MTLTSYRKSLICLSLLTMPIALSGCMIGSLATTTGQERMGEWSVEKTQHVHVGETARMSFVLLDPWTGGGIDAFDVADYCLFDVGGDWLEAEVGIDGRFTVEYTFDKFDPGDRLDICATAYREEGPRDQMKINDTWIDALSPFNEIDSKVASAKLQMVVYQSFVDLRIPPSPEALDVDGGQLLIYPTDGRPMGVYVSKPGRHGFEIHQTDDGGWRITYLPRGDEINQSGRTQIEFSAYDQAGNRRSFSRTIETP